MSVPPERHVWTINRGSATLKSALYAAGNDGDLLVSMTVDQAGVSGSRLKISDPSGASLLDAPVDGRDPNAALDVILGWLGEHSFLPRLAAAGHRLVQGGPQYKEPQRITPEFLSEIEKLAPLDPDHMPAAIQGIRFIAKKLPKLPQVACFDTAFHSSLPQVARMYALPRHLYDEGVFRYGFHGLSYEYVMRELRTLEGELADGRVIIAHLGSGASMVAVKQGKSVDTSMGFTPLEGLVMGTRSGDVDPGALLYLLEQNKMSAKDTNKLVNQESGLLGVSGTTADMKVLLGTMQQDARAAEAVNLFCYRVKKYIGAYAAVLGGLDVLVFAGGIGERAPVVRMRACEGLDFLGVRLDAASNEANAAIISSQESRVRVRVIKTDEDRMILQHVGEALGWKNV
ncbi:MAG TPA: acetate/propionate family kinase [Candidatus Acidoferrales bacterium]